MTWFVRFTVSFLCTVMLYVGAAAVAKYSQSPSILPLLFALFFAALGWLAYKVLFSGLDLMSPLVAGFLLGSVAFCAVPVFIYITLGHSPGLLKLLLLIVALMQIRAAASIYLTGSRKRPHVIYLTGAVGNALLLLFLMTAASLHSIFSIILPGAGSY